MKIRTHLFLISILISASTYSQEKIEIYLNSNFEITNKEKSECKCEAEYDLDNFRLDGLIKCVFPNGNLRMSANYAAGLKNGAANLYRANGQLIFSGHYKNNLRSGIWHYYYPDGKLMQVVKFTDDKESRSADANIMIGEFYEKSGKQLVIKGNGTWSNDSIFLSWADNVTRKTVKGTFKDSLKHGVWDLKRLNQRKSLHTEKFENGSFVTGTVLVESDGGYGKMPYELTQKLPDNFKDLFQNLETVKLDSTVFPDSVRHLETERLIEVITGIKYKIRTRSAGYKYGDYELMQYISANINYPKEARQFGYSGTVIVQLTIAKDDKAKDIKVLKGIHPSLDNEAIRVIRTINEWVSGLHEGQPYEKIIAIPVRFQL
jgi:TonB family protein